LCAELRVALGRLERGVGKTNPATCEVFSNVTLREEGRNPS
jgi:hypothetical protein